MAAEGVQHPWISSVFHSMRTPTLVFALLLAAGCSPAPESSASAVAASPEPTASVSAGEAGLQGQLAYVAGEDPQIHLLDLGTGESRQLTHLGPEDAELRAEGPMRPVLSCAFGPGSLAWSPDGSQLAFTYGGCDGVVYLTDVDGALTRIADGRSPAWSPDGGRLVFAPNIPFCPDVRGCGVPPEPGAWSLQVVDVEAGDAPVPLSLDRMTISGGQPAYSPDGSLIAFTGPMPEGEADAEVFSGAYVMAADGTNSRLVARGAWSPGWLLDGRMLIVDVQTGDLHAYDLETTEAEALGGDAGPAVAAPDGSRLLLTASDPMSGASGVQMVTLDGERLAQLEGYPAAWAPDSRAAAIVESDEAGTALVFVGRDGETLGRYDLPDAVNVFSTAAWRPGT